MIKTQNGGNTADALTGERIFPGETVYDTELPNKRYPYANSSRTLILKEDTVVWLAEQAGLVVKRDAGDSGNAKVVDGADVGVGSGEAEVGEDPVGGSKPVKRRSAGETKGK